MAEAVKARKRKIKKPIRYKTTSESEDRATARKQCKKNEIMAKMEELYAALDQEEDDKDEGHEDEESAECESSIDDDEGDEGEENAECESSNEGGSIAAELRDNERIIIEKERDRPQNSKKTDEPTNSHLGN